MLWQKNPEQLLHPKLHYIEKMYISTIEKYKVVRFFDDWCFLFFILNQIQILSTAVKSTNRKSINISFKMLFQIIELFFFNS